MSLKNNKKKKLIKEKWYHANQVSSYEETGLMGKKMPERIYLHAGAQKSPRHKRRSRDGVWRFVATHATEPLVEPGGAVCPAKNPRALQNKHQSHRVCPGNVIRTCGRPPRVYGTVLPTHLRRKGECSSVQHLRGRERPPSRNLLRDIAAIVPCYCC